MRHLYRLLGWSLVVSAVLAGPLTAPARADEAEAAGPAPTITLFTFDRGEVLWQKFGHAAICVEHPPNSRRPSPCYNYGTTDFSAPVTLGWEFLRGRGVFWVSVEPLRYMLRKYQSFDRTMWRQVLPLSEERAREVAAELARQVLPENRYYQYHHFYDNCATRVRDIVDQATGGALERASSASDGLSFRDHARRGFAEDAWLLILTDYLLGRGADQEIDAWQAMFLPWYLRDGVEQRFGADPMIVYQRTGPPISEDEGSARGWLVVLALLLAAPVAITRRRKKRERLGLWITSSALFLIALIMWFLAIITTVQEFRFNEALLLYWPSDLAMPFLTPARRVTYARVRVAVMALVLGLMLTGVFVQPLWGPLLVAFLPMAVIAEPWALWSRRGA